MWGREIKYRYLRQNLKRESVKGPLSLVECGGSVALNVKTSHLQLSATHLQNLVPASFSWLSPHPTLPRGTVNLGCCPGLWLPGIALSFQFCWVTPIQPSNWAQISLLGGNLCDLSRRVKCFQVWMYLRPCSFE